MSWCVSLCLAHTPAASIYLLIFGWFLAKLTEPNTSSGRVSQQRPLHLELCWENLSEVCVRPSGSIWAVTECLKTEPTGYCMHTVYVGRCWIKSRSKSQAAPLAHKRTRRQVSPSTVLPLMTCCVRKYCLIFVAHLLSGPSVAATMSNGSNHFRPVIVWKKVAHNQ